MKWLSVGYQLEMAYIRSARKQRGSIDNVTNHVRGRDGEERPEVVSNWKLSIRYTRLYSVESLDLHILEVGDTG